MRPSGIDLGTTQYSNPVEILSCASQMSHLYSDMSNQSPEILHVHDNRLFVFHNKALFRRSGKIAEILRRCQSVKIDAINPEKSGNILDT